MLLYISRTCSAGLGQILSSSPIHGPNKRDSCVYRNHEFCIPRSYVKSPSVGHSQVGPIVSNPFSILLSILCILSPAPQSCLNGADFPPVFRSSTLQARFVHQSQAQEREVCALASGSERVLVCMTAVGSSEVAGISFCGYRRGILDACQTPHSAFGD